MLFNLGESERSWLGMILLAVLYLGALVIAAVLAPPVHWLIQWWHETAPNALTRDIEDNPFTDTYDRLRWLPTLIALPLVLKVCGLLSWRALGVHFRGGGGRLFLGYFFLGAGMLAGVAVLQANHYGARLDGGMAFEDWVFLLAGALSGGLLIGVLEEIVFRGMAFRMIYTRFGPWLALVGTSLFFSYAHFKIPDFLWEGRTGTVDWGSGWYVAFWTLFGITRDFNPLIFLNLFLFGMVLGALVLRYRSLMAAVGLHAGIVAAILFYTDATDIQNLTAGEGKLDPLWGSGGLRDGLLTTMSFVLLCILFIGAGEKSDDELI